MRPSGFVSTRAHAALLGARAYVYGFPAVLMDRSRALFAGAGAPTNSLMHLHVVPDHTFRAVVRPNQDTLYSSAFLDLRRGPVALELPEVTERRFVSFTLLDAWSNAFASVGSRNTRAGAGGGNAARTYVIVGPDAPRDLGVGEGEVVRAPTNMVWTIGRVEILSGDDVPRIRQVQAGVVLRSLGDVATPASGADARADAEPASDPAAQVRAMSALDYFASLATVLAEQPPQGDGAILAAIAGAGIRPGAFDAGALPLHVQQGLVDGHALGQRSIALALAALSARPGWGPGSRVPLGDYGTQYLVRAVVAHVGFGANRRDEAVYMNAARDDWARPLDGSRRAYVLRFEPGGLPPVRAFWSVSLYGEDGFFVAGAVGRHVLGSHDALARSPDGALEIRVQHEAPEDARNWLPAPNGRFELTLRMYWPEPQLVEGRWRPPRILARAR